MKIGILLFACIFVSQLSNAQLKRATTDLQRVELTKAAPFFNTKFAKGSLGEYLQNTPAVFNSLTADDKKTMAPMYNMDYKTYYSSLTMKSNISQILQKYTPVYLTYPTKDSFLNTHPCGVAISKMGKVAVSTFEGDNNTPGQIYIWKNFSDFNAGKRANYIYEVNQPEAVVFDNNENLFIANTYTGLIYFTTNIAQAPSQSFSIDDNTDNSRNSNPRGMSISADNVLYVMCENVYPGCTAKSKVMQVRNAASSARIKTVVSGANQNDVNAIGVAVSDTKLFTTNLNSNQNFAGSTVTAYTLAGSNATATKVLAEAGGALDIIADGNYVYFTNVGGNLVRWNYTNVDNPNDTKHIKLPTAGVYVPWGMAVFNNYIVVTDAAEKKLIVYDKSKMPWVEKPD